MHHPPGIPEPALGWSRLDLLPLLNKHPSGHLLRLTLLAHHVVGPILAAAGEVLAMGNEALVQLASEHRNAVHPGVVPESVAGHANLAAAGLEQGVLIEVGPLFDGSFESGGQCRWPRERNTHDASPMRAPASARLPPIESCLIGLAAVESVCLWLRLVLNQERLNPVLMPPLADPIGNQGGVRRILGALRWVALG